MKKPYMHLTMTVLPCVAGLVLLFSDTLNNNNNNDMKTEDISYATWKWRVKHPDWISNHFYMGEFIYSAIAVNKGLDNTPPREACEAIRNLVRKLLEPLRERSGFPIHISSGYRCPELNRLVGGEPDSQHLIGEAVDIYTFGSAALLEALEDSRLNFDQAIFYRRRKFMHLSLKRKGKNRRQIIIL